MTHIIADKNQEFLEEIIDNFLHNYFWLSKRLSRMDQEHRDAVGILIENHPNLMLHLKSIFDKNLDEAGSELKDSGKWTVTHEEYVLMGLLCLFEEGDDVNITDYKQGSGIVSLKGEEYDSTISNQN